MCGFTFQGPRYGALGYTISPDPSFPHAHAVMRVRACACTEGSGYQTRRPVFYIFRCTNQFFCPVKPVCLQLVHPARDGTLVADLTHQPHYSLLLSSSAVGVVVELSSDHYRWVLKDDDQFCAVHFGCILCS